MSKKPFEKLNRRKLKNLSGSKTIIWYQTINGIRKCIGVPLKVFQSDFFDFETPPLSLSKKPRLKSLRISNLLFVCPADDIPQVSKYRFNSFMESLACGKISSSFPPEILEVFKEHVQDLPPDLSRVVSDAFKGCKINEGELSESDQKILELWCRYVLSRIRIKKRC